jgi:hypothetical protein
MFVGAEMPRQKTALAAKELTRLIRQRAPERLASVV